MCRYAFANYKPHYACFACRRAFRRRHLSDVNPDGPAQPATCPECGGPVASMGLDFAPPPRRDQRAWAVLAGLWELGITFHSCGCGGPGYRPRDPVAYRRFLADLRTQYEGHLAATDTPAGRAHWAARLAALDAATRAARPGRTPPSPP